MAFKFVVFLAALACANAGLIGAPVAAPVAYSPAASVSSSYIHTASAPVAHAAYATPVAHAAYAAPVAHAAYAAPVHAVHDPHYGATSQSVIRSLGGNAAVSHYTKAVDGAFSSVRKYDTRVTNDGLTAYAHAPVAHAYAAPVAHTYAKTAYAAPIAHAAYAAPVAHAYSAPVAHAYAAPVAHAAYAAPVAHAAYAAPVVAKAAYSAPVVAKAAIAYSPAVAVSHTTFEGLGTHYAW